MRSHQMKDENPWRRKPSPGAEARLLRAGTPFRQTGLHWALSLAPSKPPKAAILPFSRNISLGLPGNLLWPHSHPGSRSASIANNHIFQLFRDTSPTHESSLPEVK